MYEHVDTGPLYDQVVQLMQTYRSLSARMGGAKHSTRAKIDRTLEAIGESIGEKLGELSDGERSALTCWQDSIVPDSYELDVEQLLEQPYVSIRKIDRWDEVRDLSDTYTEEDTVSEEQQQKRSEQLSAFLRIVD